MSDYCVVVADAARARLFTLEETKVPEVESGPRLLEHKALVNPEGEVPSRAVFADTKSGRNRGGGGGPAHGYDDHRSQHEQEFERRFAKAVAGEAESLARAHHPRYLVLAAQSRMMGHLRRDLDGLVKSGVQVRESVSNLSKLSPQEIQRHLAKDGLLPECRKPGA